MSTPVVPGVGASSLRTKSAGPARFSPPGGESATHRNRSATSADSRAGALITLRG